MNRELPLNVAFYESLQGKQPCRDFILGLSKNDKREVGADIFVLQEGFPIGLPLCRKMDSDLWEIRSSISTGICRIFFTIHDNTIVLLHGFIKKTQKTPTKEIETAKNRLKEFKERNK